MSVILPPPGAGFDLRAFDAGLRAAYPELVSYDLARVPLVGQAACVHARLADARTAELRISFLRLAGWGVYG